MLNRHPIPASFFDTVEVDIIDDLCHSRAHDIIIQTEAYLFGEACFKIPKTWWDAFKLRFFKFKCLAILFPIEYIDDIYLIDKDFKYLPRGSCYGF